MKVGVLLDFYYMPLAEGWQCRQDQTFVLRMRHAKPIKHWQTTNVTLLGDAIHPMLPSGSGANTALRDASLLSRSLIAVASRGTPLHQALVALLTRLSFSVITQFVS